MENKSIINEYKECFKYFINNKIFMFIIILTAVLSYGFAITNYSVGIDDLALDRYVSGTWILSAGRWGTWLVYNILGITKFTPFWLEFVSAILIIITAITICAILKKKLKEKYNITLYIILAATYISYPLINQSFIYQPTNLSIMLNTLMVIIAGTVIYENFYNNNKISTYLIVGLLLAFPISMYEACCQTFIIWIFIMIFIDNYNKEKQSGKIIVKFIVTSIIVLIIGIITNYLINVIVNYVLVKTNTIHENNAVKNNIILESGVTLENIGKLISNFGYEIYDGFINNLPVRVFAIISIICVLLNSIVAIKKKRISNIFIMFIIIFSNFILYIFQGSILYRAYMSLNLTISFLVAFIFIVCSQKKVIKNIATLIIIIFILRQTRQLNQYFYNDNIRYNQEKALAYEIANEILNTCDDPSKPLVYKIVLRNEKLESTKSNADNGRQVFLWGVYAFQEIGTEITKFINSLGYNFAISTNEQYYDAQDDIDKMQDNQKIIETDKYIIIRLDYYKNTNSNVM